VGPHPWLPLLVTAAIVAVLVAMAFDASTRVNLLRSLLAWVVSLGAYGVHRARRRHVARVPEPEVSTSVG
jgi:GABA permease